MDNVARRIRERNRKTLTLPSNGEEVIIRKLTPVDYLAATSAIPASIVDEAKANLEDEDKIKRLAGEARDLIAGNPDRYKKFYEVTLCAGLVSPRCVPSGEEPDLDANEITAADLGVDVDYLASQIIYFSKGLDERGEPLPFREGGGDGEAEGTDND